MKPNSSEGKMLEIGKIKELGLKSPMKKHTWTHPETGIRPKMEENCKFTAIAT